MKLNALKKIILFLAFVFASLNSYGAKRYWVGNGSNKNWNSTTNWSTTSGGTSGAAVPGTSDTAYYNGNGTGQCSINANVSIKRWEMASGYTDTIKQNTYTITVSGATVLSGGTFWGGSGNITLAAFTISGNYFQSTSGTLSINGNYTFSSGTFAHNNGNVKLGATQSIIGSTDFYDLQLAGGVTLAVDASSTFNVSHLLKTTGGTIVQLNTGTINVQGDISQINNFASGGGSGTININGTGTQNFSGHDSYDDEITGWLCNIKINKSSGTLYLKDWITVKGNWEFIAGIVDATTYNSTLVFPTAGTNTIKGKQTLNNLQVRNYGGSGYTVTINTGDTLTLAGTLNIGGGGAIGFSGYIKELGDIIIGSGSNASNTITGGTGTIIINGTGTQTITGTTDVANNDARLCNVKIDKPSGTLVLKNYVNLGGNWNYIQGTIDASTYGSTVVFGYSNGRTISGKHCLYNVSFYPSANTTSTISSTDTLTVLGILKIESTAINTINTGVINVKGDVTINNTSTSGGGTATLHFCGSSNQTFTGGSGRLCNIVINKSGGTLTFKNTVSIVGNWTYLNGTMDFSTYASTVLFGNGTRKISSGKKPFYNINFYASGNGLTSVNTIPITDTLTIMGTLTTQGTTAITLDTGVVNAMGDITLTNTLTSAPQGGTGTINIAGTGSQTLTGVGIIGYGRLCSIKVNKPSGTLYLSSIFSIGDADWTYVQGTVDPGTSTFDFFGGTGNVSCGTGSSSMSFYNFRVQSGTVTLTGLLKVKNNINIDQARTLNANNNNIYVGGNWTKTGGTFTNTGSTVEFNGNSTQNITTTTFNNLKMSGTGSKSASTGNITVGGTLNLTDGEMAMNGYNLIMSSTSASSLTRSKGYISTSGAGKFTYPTASTNAYLFPMGIKTMNDSADYFVVSLTPGKSSSQKWDAALNSTNTGFVLTHNKSLYGTGASTIQLTVTTSDYNPLQFEYDIDNSANISAVRVFDQNDNTLKTLPSSYYAVSGGNQFTIINVAQLKLIYSKMTGAINLNWSYEVSYDGNGLPVSEKIQYADLMGRPTQAQVRNMADNTVFVSQTVYDNYGRAALQTLPAPTGSVIAYQNNFMTDASNNVYGYTNFDTSSKLNNPDAVNTSKAGTLGWYYSNNNTTEPFQATSSNPYGRTEFTSDPSSSTKRTAQPGDEYKMGSGHETRGYTMVSGDELRYIFGTNKSFKALIGTDKLANSAITVTGGIQAMKSIGKDADGKEMVSYSIGNLPIASCYTGLSAACTMSTITNTMEYAGTSSVDIHLPAANKSSLKLPLPLYSQYFDGEIGWVTVSSSDISFKITDLNTNVVLIEGTNYTVNSSTRAVTFNGNYATGSSFLRISFNYLSTKLDYFATHNIVIPNAIVTYDLDYSQWSVNYYDLAGHLRKSVSPLGINCASPGTITMATSYDYSSLGQLISSQSPDEGVKEITYDDEGKVRFSQNALQHTNNKFSYNNYDAVGRLIESGEYASSNNGSSSVFFQNYYGDYTAPYSGNTSSNSIRNNIGNTGMATTDCSDQTTIYYYPLPSDASEDIPSGYSYKSNYAARYLMGKVCKTKNVKSSSWYGYNQRGQTVFTVQQLADGDYTTFNTSIDSQIKTIDYNYNTENGTLIDQTYQKYSGTSEKLQNLFTYDAALRLTQIDVSIAGATALTQAKYYYYKTGALKRKELGNQLQGLDYIYTINGQLKAINHPSLDETKDPGQDGKTGATNASFGKDVFGLILDYHTSDYTRASAFSAIGATASLYNGMISAQRYKTRAVTYSVNNGADYIDYSGANQQQITNGTTDEVMNQYTYDEQYRLSKVVFGIFNNSTSVFTANTNNCYKEWGASSSGGISYDANGNITSLKRNAYNGSIGLTMDDFSYTYTSNTNKLVSIVDAATSTYSTDFDAASSKTFTYNSIGQMTRSQAENIANNDVKYNVRGLMSKVTFDNGNTAEYWYDDRGQKVKTKYYDATSNKAKLTWYVSDVAGNPLAIYEYDQTQTTPTFTLTQEVIYGAGRIGVLDKTSSVINYEITDHLGNVRATIKGISAGVYELTSRTDYYAFGGAQPGRTYNLNTYRFNYQGQESAVGTSWQAFDLRMHNSDLARWFQPDPKGQFASPYISMGNNPVSGVDPDGGYINGGTASQWQAAQKRQYDDWRNRRSLETAGDLNKDIDNWFNDQLSYLHSMEEKGYITGYQLEQKLHELNESYHYQKAHINTNPFNAGSQDHFDDPHSSFTAGKFLIDMSHQGHGGSVQSLQLMGQNTDISYEAQESDKILTLASLGGYEGRDGSSTFMDGDGNVITGQWWTSYHYDPYTGEKVNSGNWIKWTTSKAQGNGGIIMPLGPYVKPAPDIVDLGMLGGSIVKAISLVSNVISLIDQMPMKPTLDPKGKTTRVSKGQMNLLQKKGFDPHNYKPPQGNGNKIDFWFDENKDLFWKQESSDHYEKIFENIYDILGGH